MSARKSCQTISTQQRRQFSLHIPLSIIIPRSTIPSAILRTCSNFHRSIGALRSQPSFRNPPFLLAIQHSCYSTTSNSLSAWAQPQPQPPAPPGMTPALSSPPADGSPQPPLAPDASGGWRRLGAPPLELTLDLCLPTGQSFRWRRTGEGEYTGVINSRLVCLRQTPDDVMYRVLGRAVPEGGTDPAEGGEVGQPSHPTPHEGGPGGRHARQGQGGPPCPPGGNSAVDPLAGTGAGGHAGGLLHPSCDIAVPCTADDGDGDAAALVEYFQLSTRLCDLSPGWSAACEHYRALSPHFPGARLLRQDPLECLFQFICSSNNHISRIQGMVERLCSMYGTPLTPVVTPSLAPSPSPTSAPHIAPPPVMSTTTPTPHSPPTEVSLSSTAAVGAAAGAAPPHLEDMPPLQPFPSSLPLPPPAPPPLAAAATLSPPEGTQGTRLRKRSGRGQEVVAVEAVEGGVLTSVISSGSSGGSSGGGGAGGGPYQSQMPPQLSYFAFPSLTQLAAGTEEELRAAGFGYRARFIVGATRALLSRGGRRWLLGLREGGREEAVAALTELPGIGPKVAACICLFSLDKPSVVPVDTHVWQLAVRHYCPELRGRTLTPRLHGLVQAAFEQRFGPYAGWAHNTLFISELASQQHRLPPHMRRAGTGTGGKGGRGAKTTSNQSRRRKSGEEAGGARTGLGVGSGDDGGREEVGGKEEGEVDVVVRAAVVQGSRRRGGASAATTTATAVVQTGATAEKTPGGRRGRDVRVRGEGVGAGAGERGVQSLADFDDLIR